MTWVCKASKSDFRSRASWEATDDALVEDAVLVEDALLVEDAELAEEKSATSVAKSCSTAANALLSELDDVELDEEFDAEGGGPGGGPEGAAPAVSSLLELPFGVDADDPAAARLRIAWRNALEAAEALSVLAADDELLVLDEADWLD